MTPDRRAFLRLAGPALIALTATRALGEDAACYDPASLSLPQRSRRRSLGYVEKSGDAIRLCGACTFFSAAATPAPATCGTCAMLGGAPVNAGGVCNSFAPRSGKPPSG